MVNESGKVGLFEPITNQVVESKAILGVEFGWLTVDDNICFSAKVEFAEPLVEYIYYGSKATKVLEQFRDRVCEHVNSQGQVRIGAWFNDNVRNHPDVQVYKVV